MRRMSESNRKLYVRCWFVKLANDGLQSTSASQAPSLALSGGNLALGLSYVQHVAAEAKNLNVYLKQNSPCEIYPMCLRFKEGKLFTLYSWAG